MVLAFATLLSQYRERAGLTQETLGKAVGLSPSTISRIERGERPPPRRRATVLALAHTLQLSQEETDTLLTAAGFAPSQAADLVLHPRDGTLYRIAQELRDLRLDPNLSGEQVRYVEETLLLLLRGLRTAIQSMPTPTHASAPRETLPAIERSLDQLLGELIASQRPVDRETFELLELIARGAQWELKRRLVEAIPALLDTHAQYALALLKILRDDPPDPEWRSDIRRRVIEAVPALYPHDPTAAYELLHPCDGDEIYTSFAALEALAELPQEPETTTLSQEIVQHTFPEHQPLLATYADLLHLTITHPEEALNLWDRLEEEHEERLYRIALARALAHLLPRLPLPIFERMHYLLRRERGHPVEHQNVRRPIARERALNRLISLLGPSTEEPPATIIRSLATDPDLHIRRAVSDALPRLIRAHPQLALTLLQEGLLYDTDLYIRERTWIALEMFPSSYTAQVHLLRKDLLHMLV